MRIVAGAWRGRVLQAPAGDATRPTSDRARQALFDMLWHAPWAGRDTIEGARVLDAFAGTGALGLEALSRGAAHCCFLERDRAALASLRANIAALRAEDRCTLRAADATAPPHAATPCTLLFLDPPYGRDLVPAALAGLARNGWITPGALVVAEFGAADPRPDGEMLAERQVGAARIAMWRWVH